MDLTCNVCGKEVSEPIYIEINAFVVKRDTNYMGTVSFSMDEKDDLSNILILHQDCWKDLVDVKKGKKEINIKDKI